MRTKIVSLLLLFALLVGVFPVGGIALASGLEQRATFTTPIVVVNTSFLNVRTGPGIQYSVLVTVVGGTAMPVLGIARDRVWYQVSTVVGTGWVNSQYVLPRGDFSNVPFAEAPALLMPLFPSGGTGTGTGINPPSDDTAVDMGFTSQREWGVSIIADHPLRFEPSNNGLQIQGLGPDLTQIFTVVGATFNEGAGWIRISLPNGTVGWVEQTKIIFRPFACNMSAVVMRQSAELKKGPDGSGVNGGVFISEGQEAYLLDRIGNIFKIELIDGSVGWVEDSFILIRDPKSVSSDYCARGGAVVRVPGRTSGGGTTVTPGAARASIPHVVINTSFLNIRSGPGAQYTTVITLPGGTKLDVIGIAPDRVWYLVIGDFGQGWLNSEFVLFRGDGSRLPIIRGAVGVIPSPKGVINRASVTLYAAPNLTLGALGNLSGNSEYDVVARTRDGLWVQLNTPLGFGWVQAEFVTLKGDLGLIPTIG